MQLSSTTAKFKRRRPEATMKYLRNHILSKEAARAFTPIFKTLCGKAIREKAIPKQIDVWIETNEPDLNDELTRAGLIEFLKTDETGREVYRHTVDEALLKEALGWTRN